MSDKKLTCEELEARLAEADAVIEALRSQQVDAIIGEKNVSLVCQREVEEMLRESEKRYRQLFEGIGDAVMVYSSQGRFVDCNEATLQRLGYSREELFCLRAADIVHPDFRQLMKDHQERIWDGEASVMESTHRCKDGRVISVEVIARRIEYQGAPAILTVVRDITERKRAEEELTRLSSAVKTSVDSIVIIDVEGKVVDVNEAALKLYGTDDKGELIGQNILDRIAPEYREKGLAGIEFVLEQGYDKSRDYEVITKDGSRVPVELSAAVMKDADGRPIGIVNVARDVTERKRAEEERERLLVAEREQRLLAETLGEVTLALASLTSHEAVLDEILHQAQRIVPYSAANIALLEGDTLRNVRWQGYDTSTRQNLVSTRSQSLDNLPVDAKAVHSRKSVIVPDTRRDPDWTVFEETAWIRSYLVMPICSHDRTLGLLRLDGKTPGEFSVEDVERLLPLASAAAVALDNARLLDTVTQHKRDLQSLSVQLINAQEVERRRLSRELHDELGQALTAISFDLASIERELPPGLAPAIEEKLAGARSLAGEVDDRVSEIALDLRPHMLDDLGLLPALRWYVNRFARRLNIETVMEAFDLEERLPLRVETAVYRVVQETLTNISKHAQASRVHLRLERKESALLLLVEDDGLGFDVEELADRDASERGAGLLGMQERVSFLGGTFSIQSSPRQGTQLTIEIPLS